MTEGYTDSLRQIADLLQRPEVADVVRQAATRARGPAPESFVCGTCCLLGGGSTRQA